MDEDAHGHSDAGEGDVRREALTCVSCRGRIYADRTHPMDRASVCICAHEVMRTDAWTRVGEMVESRRVGNVSRLGLPTNADETTHRCAPT